MAAKKTPSFEDRLRRLQEVVASLENGELPLLNHERVSTKGLNLKRTGRAQMANERN